MWFSMWETQHILTTAKAIAEQVDESTLLSNRQIANPDSIMTSNNDAIISTEVLQGSPSGSTTAITTTIPSKHKLLEQILSSQLEEAWKILTTEGTAKDEVVLKAYMKEIGLVYSDLLKYCTEEVVRKISQHLKTIPQYGFEILMNRIKETVNKLS